MSATCKFCKKPMEPGTGCTVTTYSDFGNGKSYPRIPFGSEPGDWDGEVCPDCNAPRGGMHHPGCDVERCPRCGGQVISCDCATKSNSPPPAPAPQPAPTTATRKLAGGDEVTDTGQTIRHRGTTYAVCTTTHELADSPWVLVGRRGAEYALMRNRTRPEHLFGVSLVKTKVLPGWFTDKGGTLVSLG